ncbi:hypothetical protein ATERTT37_007696 [Aspergillus terreus]
MSASTYDSPIGFALRRSGGCLSDEVSCGHTWGDFYACCPGSTVCPGSRANYYNQVCCPSWSNCTIPLVASPHCANDSASMFDHTGYFCCLPGQTGFWTSNPPDAVGCSDELPDNVNETIIAAISQSGTVASSTLATTSGTSTSTSTSTSTGTTSSTATSSPDDTGSGTNTGAIAGGVVGGVAGLAIILALLWFFLRKRKQPENASAPLDAKGPSPPGELDGRSQPSELPGDHEMMHELPAGKMGA